MAVKDSLIEFLCYRWATDIDPPELLKAEVITLFLNKGASVEEVDYCGRTALQLALSWCQYETAAIQILIDRTGVTRELANIKHDRFGNLLHFALTNIYCKRNIVELLLQNDVRCDELNSQGRTPLHNAMFVGIQDLGIIKLLIKNGSSVDLKCKYGYTPLSLAVRKRLPVNIIFTLLASGASIIGLCDQDGVPLLKQVLKEPAIFGIDRCKILLKFALIENPNLLIKGLIKDHSYNLELTSFTEECIIYLRRTECVKIDKDITLSEFIKGHYSQNVAGDYKPKCHLHIDQLLQALSNTPSLSLFYNYHDVISSKISKSLLMEKLHQLSVYTKNNCCDYPYVEHKTVLKYYCLEKIAKYLTKRDLLCLILAYYFTYGYVFND